MVFNIADEKQVELNWLDIYGFEFFKLDIDLKLQFPRYFGTYDR